VSELYAFRHLATRKIKQIIETNTHNMLHKIHHYYLKYIKNVLEQNKLTIAKADKRRTVVIVVKKNDKETENHKNSMHLFIEHWTPVRIVLVLYCICVTACSTL
jgi:uncharacterized protein YggL (DUF469 family)